MHCWLPAQKATIPLTSIGLRGINTLAKKLFWTELFFYSIFWSLKCSLKCITSFLQCLAHEGLGIWFSEASSIHVSGKPKKIKMRAYASSRKSWSGLDNKGLLASSSWSRSSSRSIMSRRRRGRKEVELVPKSPSSSIPAGSHSSMGSESRSPFKHNKTQLNSHAGTTADTNKTRQRWLSARLWYLQWPILLWNFAHV